MHYFPYRDKDTGKPDAEQAFVLQTDSWAHYFVDFASLEWYPTANELATNFNKDLAGKEASFQDLMSQVVPKIRKTFENTGGATTKNLTVRIDNVSIRFSYSDFEKHKVVFCNFGGKVVGLVIGSHFIPKYGGTALSAKVTLEKVSNLNELVLQQ